MRLITSDYMVHAQYVVHCGINSTSHAVRKYKIVSSKAKCKLLPDCTVSDNLFKH